jgi:hypothetical protein
VNKIFLLLIISPAIFLTSCKKNENSAPPASKGYLGFYLYTNSDTTVLNAFPDTVYIDSARKVIITNAELLMSNIKLIETNGNLVPLTGTVIAVHRSLELYNLDSVPSINYNALMFDLGFNATTNAMPPAAFADTTNGLGAYLQTMYLGAGNGYNSVKFTGFIDTTNAMNGNFKTGAGIAPFSFILSGSSALTIITMPYQPFVVPLHNEQFVHIICDYSGLFNNLSLHQNLMMGTNNPNNDSLTTRLISNIPSMFRYQQ